MSLDAVAWSPVGGLPMDLPAEAPPGAPGGLQAPAGGLPGMAPDAVPPALGLAEAPLASDTAAQPLPDNAPWGSPADELAAGGQLRGLTEMARELARGSHALRSAEDSALTASRAGGATGEAVAAAPGATLAELAPAASLLPGVLAALHLGAAERPRTSADTAPRPEDLRAPRDRRRRDDQAGSDDKDDADAQDGNESIHDEPRLPAHPQSAVDTVPPDAAWCAPLLAALQRCAVEAPAAEAALKAAADAWARGRAVLLACPASYPTSLADAQAAWLFVLRPRPGPVLRLDGERFDARLRWARSGARRWWLVRVAKSYSLRRGGQLVTHEESFDGRVACELQLGPFPPALPRWREALVRVDRVQRLWQALGTQWSLPLLVCDEPLLLAVPARGAMP